jgi:cobalt-precorrin 5A hydrolase
LDKAVIVAGVGCRRGAPASDIEAAIRAALSHADIAADALDGIATIAAKGAEVGVQTAAKRFGVSVVLVSDADLQAAESRTQTPSERVRALTGVSSVAEAAALAAVGPTARLISPRLVMGISSARGRARRTS